MAKKDIIKHQFKKGDHRINREGRPKKFVSQVLDDLKKAGYINVTKRQIIDIYESLLALPYEELVKMAQDKSKPMIFRIIAKAMLGKNGFDIIERMVDRAHGRPKNSLELDDKEPPVAWVRFIKNKPNGGKKRKKSKRKHT